MVLLALRHYCFEVAFINSIHHQGVPINLQCSTLLSAIGICGYVGGTRRMEWLHDIGLWIPQVSGVCTF